MLKLDMGALTQAVAITSMMEQMMMGAKDGDIPPWNPKEAIKPDGGFSGHLRELRKHAALIVASPPCQEYSYMAMPWSRAKKIAREYRDGTRDRAKLTALFDACFRLQR